MVGAAEDDEDVDEKNVEGDGDDVEQEDDMLAATTAFILSGIPEAVAL